ncbi:MAG: hypothetical protein M1570_18605 [Chloroflexi bacterium]|nr:hypothetical protein [Chloroflexota bacterium]
MTKHGLPTGEYEAIQAELKQMRDRLGEIAASLSHAYPLGVADALVSAQVTIDEARNKLQRAQGGH